VQQYITRSRTHGDLKVRVYVCALLYALAATAATATAARSVRREPEVQLGVGLLHLRHGEAKDTRRPDTMERTMKVVGARFKRPVLCVAKRPTVAFCIFGSLVNGFLELKKPIRTLGLIAQRI
jgi:lipopolysaccharide biosynthesis regulator YciM